VLQYIIGYLTYMYGFNVHSLKAYTNYLKKSEVIRNRPWKPIDALHVSYEHHLHVKSKAIPVTCRGDSWVCFL
jgi:hypothetical protein